MFNKRSSAEKNPNRNESLTEVNEEQLTSEPLQDKQIFRISTNTEGGHIRVDITAALKQNPSCVATLHFNSLGRNSPAGLACA